MAKQRRWLRLPGPAYEGLTVDFLELLYSAGGSVSRSDGKKATIDSPQAQQVLSFMQQGIKDGAVPQAISPTWRRSRGTPSRPARCRSCATGRTCTRWQDRPRAVRRRAAADLAGRQAGERARRLQPRDLDVLEEPGRGAELHRLRHRPGGAEEVLHQVVAAGRADADLQRSGGGQGAAVRADAADRRSRTDRRDRSRRCIRRSARRSTRTSTRRFQRHVPVDRADEGAEPDQVGAEDVLGQHDGDTAEATFARPRRRRRSGLPERRLAAAMVSPSLIVIAIVAAYPIVYAIWLSLHQYSVIHPGPVALGGPRQLHATRSTSSTFWSAVKTTFIFTAISVALELVIGMGMAL